MTANPYIKRLMAAFSYLTCFFPGARGKEMPAKSLAYLTAVGLVLGCLLWLGAYLLDGFLYPQINALCLLVILTIFTRGLGLDGLARLLDSLGKGGTAKETARALRSPQRGSFGIIAIALAVLAKYLLMAQLIEEGAFPSLLLFPVLGRWSMVCLVWFFPDLQEKPLVDHPQRRDLWWAAGIALACSLLAQGLSGLGIMVLVWIGSYGLGRYCIKRIGCVTPQVMAAAGELVELLTLAACVALLNSL